jgi:ketosteroid isomerase-like protein
MGKTIAFIVLLVAGCHQLLSAQTSFRSILIKHLNAIDQKNLADIEATVADSVTLILPNGEVLKSKKSFVDLHREWFKENWKMATETISVRESSTLAHALVKYHYKEWDADQKLKSESNTYLLLIFEKGKDGWKLVHDQNTKISPKN